MFKKSLLMLSLVVAFVSFASEKDDAPEVPNVKIKEEKAPKLDPKLQDHYDSMEMVEVKLVDDRGITRKLFMTRKAANQIKSANSPLEFTPYKNQNHNVIKTQDYRGNTIISSNNPKSQWGYSSNEIYEQEKMRKAQEYMNKNSYHQNDCIIN